MSVRAKFTVQSLTLTKYGSELNTTVKLVPVTNGSSENDEFFKWTPSGSIDIGIVKEATAQQFEIGASYYVDFTKAE